MIHHISESAIFVDNWLGKIIYIQKMKDRIENYKTLESIYRKGGLFISNNVLTAEMDKIQSKIQNLSNSILCGKK